MEASLIQVNVSRGGIPKRPIDSGYVGALGIHGDAVAHPQYHGGPNQAILLITMEAIEEIAAMGYPVYAGALGENFTVLGLDRTAMRLGDRYRIGDCVIELSKMRRPCRTLDVYGAKIQKEIFDAQVKEEDASSRRWGLAGFYARVIEEGLVRTGDSVIKVSAVPSIAIPAMDRA